MTYSEVYKAFVYIHELTSIFMDMLAGNIKYDEDTSSRAKPLADWLHSWCCPFEEDVPNTEIFAGILEALYNAPKSSHSMILDELLSVADRPYKFSKKGPQEAIDVDEHEQLIRSLPTYLGNASLLWDDIFEFIYRLEKDYDIPLKYEDEDEDDVNDNNTSVKLFDQLLINDNKEDVIRHLKNIPEFRAKRVGLALKMMEQEGIMHPIGKGHQSRIHRDLTEIFGNIGGRKSVFNYYDDFKYTHYKEDVASIKSAYFQS